jgi:hypothetical protein
VWGGDDVREAKTRGQEKVETRKQRAAQEKVQQERRKWRDENKGQQRHNEQGGTD